MLVMLLVLDQKSKSIINNKQRYCVCHDRALRIRNQSFVVWHNLPAKIDNRPVALAPILAIYAAQASVRV